MTSNHPHWLVAFANESNKIEGMAEAQTKDLDGLAAFLALGDIKVGDLEAYVKAIEPRHVLRRREGLNVRVGQHIAPFGGPEIERRLSELLADMPINHPYKTHIAYETLHPFTDGNGRSGRALWLWHHMHYGNGESAKALGFLHAFYYETLHFSDERRAA